MVVSKNKPIPRYRHLSLKEQGDLIVVRFGECCFTDHEILDEVFEELQQVASRAGYRHLVLNFSGVDHIPSLLLGKLLLLSRQRALNHGKLILCEVRPEVRMVFSKTRLDQILRIRDTEADAV